MSNRVNGVSFDGTHSYYDLDLWFSERPDLGSPDPKINAVEVPGSDGVIDLTEANSGEVKYTNRIMVFTFAAMVPHDRQSAFRSRISNCLHGKHIKQIVLDEDPEWYYSGRASVAFTDVTPWKLRCVVTIDAAPYAMKIQKTAFDLSGANMLAELNTYDFPTTLANENQTWNTDLRLGTEEFPGGLIFPGGSNHQLIIRWPENAEHIKNRGDINIVSTENGVRQVYNGQTAPFSAGETRINASTLTTAGLTLSKIWRVLVSHFGGCTLHAEMLSYHFRIWNERKSVVPSFMLDTDADITFSVILNGKTIIMTNGASIFPEFVLKQGWNELFIPRISDDVTVNEFTMTFREGKL